MKRLAALAAALLCFSSFSCSVPGKEASEPEPELRIYSVPGGTANELRSVLASTLSRGEGNPPAGRVSVTPDGQLLVLAAPTIHKGVKELVDTAKEDPATEVVTLELTYWLVAGEPASASSEGGSRVAPQVDPLLAEVEQALGPMRFRLLEQTRLTSRAGSFANSQGRYLHVTQQAVVVGDQVVADLNLARVSTEVSFRDGQTLILAQQAPPRSQFDELADGAIFLYVVQAKRLPQAG